MWRLIDQRKIINTSISRDVEKRYVIGNNVIYMGRKKTENTRNVR